MGRAHHEGAVAAQSVSNSGEGRCFDDRQWTRGKYTRRGASWGAFGRLTSCEMVEVEGGHARWLLAEAIEMERGGPARGGHTARRREGVQQGQVVVVVSGRPATRESTRGGRGLANRGARWGSNRGEKRRTRMPAWKRKKHGPDPKE
jgi:hypothetical protein